MRDPADQVAWQEFDAKYRDLLLRYCRARGLQPADAEDVRQMVMLALSKALRGFHYNAAKGRFRSYLGTAVRNAVTVQMKRPAGAREQALDTLILATVPGEDAPGEDETWKREWVNHHYRLAMQTVRATFEPRSMQAFDRLAAGERVATVAADLDLSEQAVHKVKQRVRNRLKELIAAQIREEDFPDG